MSQRTAHNLGPFLRAITIMIALLCISGCSIFGIDHPGRVKYRNETTGERLEVTNPPKALAPAMLSRGVDGTFTASASAPRRDDTAIKQLWSIPLVGVGLILLGATTLTLRGWFPSVPMSASLASMATGGMLIAIPKIVQEAWWMIALIVTVPIVLYAISWFDNHHKLNGNGNGNGKPNGKPKPVTPDTEARSTTP